MEKKVVQKCFLTPLLKLWVPPDDYQLDKITNLQTAKKKKTNQHSLWVVLIQLSTFISLLDCSKGVGRSFPGMWARCLCPVAEKMHINAQACLVVFTKNSLAFWLTQAAGKLFFFFPLSTDTLNLVTSRQCIPNWRQHWLCFSLGILIIGS